MVDVSIIIPIYNERKALKKLIPDIAENLHEHHYEMIVVDDSSPDGTAATARELANNFPVKVIERPRKLGLSSAVVKGATKIIKNGHELFLHGNKSVYVSEFMLHRNENLGKIKLRTVEMQTGGYQGYQGKDDIAKIY